MVSDDDLKAKQNRGCGPQSDSHERKNKHACEDKKKKPENKCGQNPFNRGDCKEPKKSKKECDQSQKKFRQEAEDAPPTCKDEESKKDDKCRSSYEDFGKSKGGESPCKSKDTSSQKPACDCRDAYQKYIQGKLEASRGCDLFEENTCQSQKAKPENLCSEPSKTKPEISCKENKKDDCSCQKKSESGQKSRQTKSKSCSESAKKEPCGAKKEKTDDSLYSKFKNCCKDIAKGIGKQNNKCKYSGAEELSIGKEICTKTTVSGSPPCPPQTEKGTRNQQTCAKPTAVCPQTKIPSWADFFPIDARNQKLNDCIEKYSKIDPGLVISKCSKFADRTLATTSECLSEQMKKAREQCMRGVRHAEEPVPQKATSLISPWSRHMMRRWAPSAGFYLATSAVAVIYVTEWQDVLQYVPFFRNAQEESEKVSSEP